MPSSPSRAGRTLGAARFVAVVTLVAANTAAAQDVRGFLSRGDFEAALAGRSDLSLYGLAPANGSVAYSDASPLSLDGGAFGTLTAAGPGFVIAGQGVDDRGRLATARPTVGAAYQITLAFSSPITAFGADYLPNTATGSQTFTLSAPELGVYTLATSETGFRFFGITSSTAFSSAIISANAPIYYDRPTLGEADAPVAAAGFRLFSGAVYPLPLPVTQTVPEPSTIALLAGGLVTIGVARRARRRRDGVG